MNKPKKLFFVLPNLHAGGAERIITYLCNHLDTKKFTPVLVLFQKEGSYLDYLQNDIQIIELHISRIRYLPLKLIPLLRKEKPDIVFTGWGEISAYLAPWISFFPTISFVARETNIISEHVTRKDIRFFYRFYRNFKTIIAQSDDMKADLMQELKLPEESIIKINNPVDMGFMAHQLTNSTFPEEFSNEHKNVLAVGNLTHRKGFDLLLQVFSHLKDQNIHLYIMGDGDDKDTLLQLKTTLGLEKVHFIGKRNNPFPYYKYADLFVLSSRYEGFPNVLLEANACGTYALCNDVKGGVNEIIQPKVNGEIFDITQSEVFAQKLVEVIHQSHPAAPIINSITTRYALSQIIQQYEEVLSRL